MNRQDVLRPCPFCGGGDLVLEDFTDRIYGFWDYRIKCKTCRAFMNSPSTADIQFTNNGLKQTRNEETKARAKRELVIAWNTRANDTPQVEDDFPDCKISGCEAARKDCHKGCPNGKKVYCKHTDACMDGVYCKAGHGGSYGRCDYFPDNGPKCKYYEEEQQ